MVRSRAIHDERQDGTIAVAPLRNVHNLATAMIARITLGSPSTARSGAPPVAGILRGLHRPRRPEPGGRDRREHALVALQSELAALRADIRAMRGETASASTEVP